MAITAGYTVLGIAAGTKKAGHLGVPGFFMVLEAKGLEAFAFQALAFHLACATNCFSRLTSLTLRRLFKVAAQLHFTENAFALHFLFECLKSLIDIVVTDENVHLVTNPCFKKPGLPRF